MKKIILVLVLVICVSCAPLSDRKTGIQEIGAWGPIIIENHESAADSFLVSEKDFDERIELIPLVEGKNLFLHPVVGLKSGETYQIINNLSKNLLTVRVRKPCIVYIGNPGGESEIFKKCAEADSIQLTSTDGKVKDFTVSKTGEWIFYTLMNSKGDSEIWEIKPDGSNKTFLYDCVNSICSDLVFNPFAHKLAFIQVGNNPMIKIMNLDTEDGFELKEAGSDLDFSPDGNYLSFLQNNSEQLVIFDLSDLTRVSLQSGAGLVGEWKRDSKKILYGNLDYWGGIPGVRVLEFDVNSGISSEILFDPNQDHEYFHPGYSSKDGEFFALTRTRNSGASKDFCFFNAEGEKISQLNSDPLFHYSFPSFSADYSNLLFQRFPSNTSKGIPQVVLWNRETGKEDMIIDNAIKPFWLP